MKSSSGAGHLNAGRRCLILALLLAFALPWLAPLLASAQQDDAGLPACCRRNGRHHCMMSMAERAAMAGGERAVSAPWQPCPFFPRQIAFFPGTVPGTEPPPAPALAPPAAFRCGPQQLSSRRRAAEVRTRHKRGPPARFPTLQQL